MSEEKRVEHVLSEAMVAAGQDMDEAQKRIVAARQRLAAANKKYQAYQRGARPA